MLDLMLREEFREARLRDTAIELKDDNDTGATQVSPGKFLKITYPTHDVLKSVKSVCNRDGRPIVVIGERGSGKSHLMAVLYHSANNPDSTQEWLNSWSNAIDSREIEGINFRRDMLVIGESLHHQNYKNLWDILFDRHPNGEFFKGKWEGMETDVPSFDIILEMVKKKPVMLILDEFQTWYETLSNSAEHPMKERAFNFIQILSEISQNHPDNLVLVVSVRNGDSDAYKQIHRVNPILIDFKSGGIPEKIQRDRRNMLLYRLFENRVHIADSDIEQLINVHVSEYFSLLGVSTSEHERKQREFIESWPFAPHLLQLLEDQVLIATDAQETRDLIKILANLFKSRGNDTPILTAADFNLSEDDTGIGALLDSVANAHHRTLRDKAMRNYLAVTEAVSSEADEVPNLKSILGALWLRSISVDSKGADAHEIHADITKDSQIDPNSFQVELDTIIENSFNIHKIEDRYVFKEIENPQAKVMASAKNDKLFQDQNDYRQLADEIRYVISGTGDNSGKFRIIVMQPPNWTNDPWTDLSEKEHPDNWEGRIPIIVLPESKVQMSEQLGKWLIKHVLKNRNTIRFLLPNIDYGLFNRRFLILSRAIIKSKEWEDQSTEYRKLHSKYKNELHGELKKCFDRFAILKKWDYNDPSNCEFHTEMVRNRAENIPNAIEQCVIDNLFEPEAFESFILKIAESNKTVGNALEELKEPMTSDHECIPWLGELLVKEQILRICSKGKITINVRGNEILQMAPGETEEQAWHRLKGKLTVSGRQLDEVVISKFEHSPQSGGTIEKTTESAEETELSGDTNETGKTDSDTTSSPNPLSNPMDNKVKDWSAESYQENSPLNLIAELERRNVGPATPVKDVKFKVTARTGAQIYEVLKKIPDGIKVELSLEKGETDGI